MTDFSVDSKAAQPLIKPDSLAASLASAPSRTELEKRVQDINTGMAALTPASFEMPDSRQVLSEQPSALQARIKKNELVVPDTEVLRQLLLEKARIARQLDAMPPHTPMESRTTDFSLAAKKPTLR